MTEEDKKEVKKIFGQIVPGLIAFTAASLLIKFYGSK